MTIRVINDNGDLTYTTDANGDGVLHGALMFEIDRPGGGTITIAIDAERGVVSTWADAQNHCVIQPSVAITEDETSLTYFDREGSESPRIHLDYDVDPVEIVGRDFADDLMTTLAIKRLGGPAPDLRWTSEEDSNGWLHVDLDLKDGIEWADFDRRMGFRRD